LVDQAQSPDEDDPDFRKSFLRTRIVIGVVGVLMPVVLVFGDHLIFHQPWPKPSLSDYYHSGMRDWFVGSLWAIGAGLLVYLAARRNIGDSRISFIAGLFAILVSLLPTNELAAAPTLVAYLHLGCAIALFALLGVICFRFGRRDGRSERRTERWRKVWSRLHQLCAVIIWLAIAACIASTMTQFHDDVVVLLGESTAVFAFGTSWFLKGSELFNVRREEKGKAPLLRRPA
jgi:hypothetical protein